MGDKSKRKLATWTAELININPIAQVVGLPLEKVKELAEQLTIKNT